MRTTADSDMSCPYTHSYRGLARGGAKIGTVSGDYCASSSSQAGEGLAGTAVAETHAWIVIEVREPWARAAIDADALAPIKATIERWIAVDLLLAPSFHRLPKFRADFYAAYGDPDTKARDAFQTIKVLFHRNGRGAEIWW